MWHRGGGGGVKEEARAASLLVPAGCKGSLQASLTVMVSTWVAMKGMKKSWNARQAKQEVHS